MTEEQKNNNSADIKTELSSKEDIKAELSKVASNPKQNAAIIALIGLIFAYLSYNILQGSREEQDNSKEVIPVPTEVVRKDTADITTENIQIPSLPEPPKLESPSAPPPPPPPVREISKAPELPALPSMTAPTAPAAAPEPFVISTHEEEKSAEEDAKKKQLRRSSSIMLLSGKNATTTSAKSTTIANSVKKDSSIDYAKYFVLNRGKIIDAIIETALNTDTGGEVRAIISKDVYADHGNYILIPRGSEILGTYKTDMKTGRMDVSWTRLNLDDDYYLDLSESSVDNLGRKGIQGRLDEKNKEKLINTIFVSAFNMGVGSILDSMATATTDPNSVSQKGLSDSIEIRTAMTTITNDKTIASDMDRITKICSDISQKLLEKKYTSMYTELQTKCGQIAPTNDPATAAASLNELNSLVNSQALALIQSSTATAATESNSAKSSKDAFDEVTGLAKSILSNDQLKPTVTLDQGTTVKIYLKQNYFFPKEIVRKN
jgi:type IV secretion system protein VirB10